MVVTLPSWLLALTALPPASLPVTNHFSITKVIGFLSQDLMLQHHPLPAFLSPQTRCFPPAGLTSTAAGERREREQVRSAAEARAYNLTRTAVHFVRTQLTPRLYTREVAHVHTRATPLYVQSN